MSSPAASSQARGAALFTARGVLLGSCWALLLVGLLVAGATRLMTLNVNILNIDEAAYAAEAVRALDTGTIVLKSSRDNKPPGIVAAYAATFELFGRYNMAAVRAVALACVAATGALLFFFCRRWLSSAAGASAAGFYFLATSLDLRFIAFKTELLMSLPLCAAVCLSIDSVLRAEQTATRRHAQQMLAGLCLALAIATRQTAAFIFVGLWLGILFAVMPRPPVADLQRLVAGGLFCVAGALIGLGMIAAIYLRADAWPELWRQAVEFPRDFASVQRYSVAQRAMRFVTYLEEYFRYSQVLFGLALYGLVATCMTRRSAAQDGDREEMLPPATAGALVASIAAFAAAPDMYPAYFLQLFIPLALAFALGVHRQLKPKAVSEAQYLVALLVIFSVMSAAVLALKAPMKHALGQTESGQRHPLDDLIRAKANPDDRLLVWGFRPQFYVNSGLGPATRFTLTDVLVGLRGTIGKDADPDAVYPYYEPDGWRHFIAELSQERPRFIVDGLYMANVEAELSLRRYPALLDHVQRHYRVIATTPDRLTLYERIEPSP